MRKALAIAVLLVAGAGLIPARAATTAPTEDDVTIPTATAVAPAHGHGGSAPAGPAGQAEHERLTFREKATPYDWVVVFFYLGLMATLGFIFHRFNKSAADYFRTGSRTVWWMVGSTSFMTSFSAWTFTGAASQAYATGISVATLFLANTVGFMINAAVFAAWYRQTRATTLPEILRTRFNVPTQQLYAWVNVLYQFLMAGLHLWGVSIFLSTLFDLSIASVILVVGACVVCYAVFGGSWGVQATDFVQSLILVPITVLVAVLSLMHVGGIGAFVTRILERPDMQSHLHLIETGPAAKFTLIYVLAICLKQILTFNSLNDTPKYFSVKDGKDARKAALLAGILMLIGSMLWFIPPILARLEYSRVVDAVPLRNPAESAYAVTAIMLLPPGLIGLMAVAMLAATMGTMNSALNRNAAILTRDIVKGLLWKAMQDKTQVVVGRICAFVSGSGVVGLALYFSAAKGEGIFDKMIAFGALFAIPNLVPLFWALFIKRAPHFAALAAVLAAFSTSVVSLVYAWDVPTTIFTNFSVGTAVFLLCAFGWPATGEAKQRIDTFYERMHTPIDFTKEVGKSVDRSQFRIIGLTSLLIGVLILGCFLIPGDHSRIPFLFVAGFIGGLGAFFTWYSFKKGLDGGAASASGKPEAAV